MSWGSPGTIQYPVRSIRGVQAGSWEGWAKTAPGRKMTCRRRGGPRPAATTAPGGGSGPAAPAAQATPTPARTNDPATALRAGVMQPPELILVPRFFDVPGCHGAPISPGESGTNAGPGTVRALPRAATRALRQRRTDPAASHISPTCRSIAGKRHISDPGRHTRWAEVA